MYSIFIIHEENSLEEINNLYQESAMNEHYKFLLLDNLKRIDCKKASGGCHVLES